MAQAETALKEQLAKAARQQAELQERLEAASKANSESKAQQDKARTDLEGQLASAIDTQKKLSAERDALSKAKEAEVQAKGQLQSELVALVQSEKVLNEKFERLALEREAMHVELQELIQSGAQLKAQQEKAKAECAVLIKAKDAEVTKNKESLERQRHLESTNQDLQNRQLLLHEELVKAEAQIELIKDLLLREQGI